MNELRQLDINRITDPLLKNELWGELRGHTGSGWILHTIEPDEELRPDLAAYRLYQDHTLRWVVLVRAGVDDPRGSLPVGENIYLPPVVWLREIIKKYERKDARY